MAVMSLDGSNLATRLRDALVALTPERPDAIDALRAVYADDIHFRDPIQEIRGIDAFLAMNRRLLARMRTLEWIVVTAAGDDEEVFLEWTMRGRTKLGPTVSVDGMTRARGRGGKITDHRDYWDLGELLASSMPAGKRLLHALVSPLA